jgi:hypothetical protein
MAVVIASLLVQNEGEMSTASASAGEVVFGGTLIEEVRFTLERKESRGRFRHMTSARLNLLPTESNSNVTIWVDRMGP